MKKVLALIALLWVLSGCRDVVIGTQHSRCMARNDNVLERCTQYEGKQW